MPSPAALPAAAGFAFLGGALLHMAERASPFLLPAPAPATAFAGIGLSACFPAGADAGPAAGAGFFCALLGALAAAGAGVLSSVASAALPAALPVPGHNSSRIVHIHMLIKSTTT